jgi:hypothetical protein
VTNEQIEAFIKSCPPRDQRGDRRIDALGRCEPPAHIMIVAEDLAQSLRELLMRRRAMAKTREACDLFSMRKATDESLLPEERTIKLAHDVRRAVFDEDQKLRYLDYEP